MVVSNKLISLYNKIIQMNNGSSNPSDYEFLLRTLTEGNHVAKAESLKRFNTLILSDKKQFSTYAKRIVIALQDLILEPKEDVNLLAGTLALQIINLNPRDIEFYIKTKLLRSMVINLGDSKPQIRKTSHYCLLAYIRMFKNFDDLIGVYIANGLMSDEWQLRQKAINSFQSILVMEIKYLNWSSAQFKRIFELLLGKLKDQNGFVQKAAEQCLLSLSKVEDIRQFSKKLSPTTFNQLKIFSQQQYELGNLAEIKLDIAEKKHEYIQKKQQVDRYSQIPQSPEIHNHHAVSLINTEKIDKYQNYQKQLQENISNKKIERTKAQRASLRKAESMLGVNAGKQLQYSLNLKSVRNQQRQQKSLKRQSSLIFPPILGQNSKQQKLEQVMGKKVLQDLRNDKDWKTRLEAIQEFQTKFQISKQEIDIEVVMKNILPILIRLLGDANFKVALIALKIVQQILRIPSISLEVLAPQIVQKLSDNKVALRQNISKLIKSEYLYSKQSIWIDNLLLQIKKASNANVKQQILNILLKLYEDGNISYSFQKILETVIPLMDDLKTKIKIKTLDLLALVTIKSQKIDRAKNFLATKMNQVYYEMYLEKISKQLKIYREANPSLFQNQDRQKQTKNSMSQMTRKLNKIGNTTSTSLQRFSPQKQQNSTVKTAFYDAKVELQQKMNSINQGQVIPPKEKEISQVEQTIGEIDSSPRKRNQNRYMRRRTNKSIQSRLSTTNYSNEDAFPPFHDPSKQLKILLVELKSQDWQISNEALNKFHRIIIHHQDLLINSVIKLAMPDLMKLAQSLRSTLSKNALVVLNQLSLKVKRQLDSEFDAIFAKLIKKSLDANSFISQEVKRALITICSNCNESKVITNLNTSHTSRAIPIKTAICNILEGITFLPKFYQRELERITLILIDFMGQGSLQIREKTKNLLNHIILSEKGASIMKLIPLQLRNKLKKREEPNISQLKLPVETGSPIVQKQKQVVKQSQVQEHSRRKKKIRITDFPSQFEDIDNYLQGCQSSDWKTRLQSMSLISDICLKFSEQIGQYKSSSRIIDVLSKQINDPNVRVAINALKVFQGLTRHIPALIENSLSVIMNEVFICFSSMKAQIRSLAQQFFDSICQSVEKWMLTQHICNGALYSLQKSKPLIIQKLNKLVPQIYKIKPMIFQKNVYPMINKLADQNRPQMVSPLKQLLQTIYTQIGQDCMSYLKQKAKNLIYQQ